VSLERETTVRTKERDYSTANKDATQLAESLLFVLDVFEHFVQQYPLERLIGERQIFRSGNPKGQFGDVGPSNLSRRDRIRTHIDTDHARRSTMYQAGGIVAFGAAAVQPRALDQPEPLQLA
jgi:hypothetical protein